MEIAVTDSNFDLVSKIATWRLSNLASPNSIIIGRKLNYPKPQVT
jgi:hypothetical protein